MQSYGPAQTPSAPHYCMVCRQRFVAPGMCPRCHDEPLLDLRDEDTWEFFEQSDARARYKRFGQMVALCLPIGLVLTVPLFMLGFVYAPLLAAGAAAATASFLARKFPPRPIRPSISTDEWDLIRSAP